VDKQTLTACKRAIREIWRYSKTYKDLISSTRIGRGDFQCQNCNSRNNNRSDMYVEHVICLASQGLETLDQYYDAMRDLSNLEVWSKTCCKLEKDKADRKLLRELKEKDV